MKRQSLFLAMFLVALTGCHHSATVVINPDPTPTPTYPPVRCMAANGASSGCIGIGIQPVFSYSHDQNSKDVDLQRAELEESSIRDRANSVAEQFDMKYDAALQLTQLADRIQAAGGNSGMTAEDRQAVTSAALNVAGITAEELGFALSQDTKGDETATEALLQKAAVNLGMRSSAALRDQLLPALGVDLR